MAGRKPLALNSGVAVERDNCAVFIAGDASGTSLERLVEDRCATMLRDCQHVQFLGFSDSKILQESIGRTEDRGTHRFTHSEVRDPELSREPRVLRAGSSHRY